MCTLLKESIRISAEIINPFIFNNENIESKRNSKNNERLRLSR